jgi:hypothetical protein
LEIGNRKSKFEISNLKIERRKVMSEELKKMDIEELEEVAGGNDGLTPNDQIHNLAWFTEHKVAHLPAGTTLVMKTTHSGRGSVMPGHYFHNGDTILIHSRYWEGGCFLAFDKGEFGYVDAQYVR